MTAPVVEVRRAPELDVATLHGILQLRSAVFVVEQDCVYPDIDGRDLEPSTVHLFTRDGDAVTSCVRLLEEPEGTVKLGRVCTRRDVRRVGLATALMRRALEVCEGRTVVLHAQRYLEAWYATFGFVRTGPDFDEDGMPHVPMRRLPGAG